MASVRRAIRIARAATRPVPVRLHDLPEDVLAADASAGASAAGHDAWRQVAEIVDDEAVIEAVDDHVVALLASAVNLGILTLAPDVHERLLDRFDRHVRPAIDAEVAARMQVTEGPGGVEHRVFSSSVRDHVWLYQTTRVAAALDPAQREHLEQMLPAVIGVGLRAYRERGRDASRGAAHLAGGALVALAVGGALYDAVAGQALDPASLSAMVGSLAAVTGLQARRVSAVRSSGMVRAGQRDAVDTAASGEPATGSLSRLRTDVEVRRVAVRAVQESADGHVPSRG